jgi:hypothetical protein
MKYFMIGVLVSVLIASCTEAMAHEMTPTYPKLKPSHLSGISVATMKMFNKREDVEYYEIGVFDSEWKPIPFVTSYNIIKLDYLGHVTFDVYIRDKDKTRATYICSKSKLRKSEKNPRTAITSRICSKFK